MTRRATRIGLVFGYGLDYYRDILRGIKAFAESRPQWIFTPIAPEPSAVRAMRPLDHHGMIAHVFDPDLPTNPKGTDQGTPLTPSSVDIAGYYLFVGMVKPDGGRQYTHVLRVSDGRYVGSLSPGPEVGGSAGWQDMPYAIQAFRRKDGEHLVLVEEDWRGKNLLYRWRPEDTPGPAGKER